MYGSELTLSAVYTVSASSTAPALALLARYVTLVIFGALSGGHSMPILRTHYRKCMVCAVHCGAMQMAGPPQTIHFNRSSIGGHVRVHGTCTHVPPPTTKKRSPPPPPSTITVQLAISLYSIPNVSSVRIGRHDHADEFQSECVFQNEIQTC